jgi:hypothetical protein
MHICSFIVHIIINVCYNVVIFFFEAGHSLGYRGNLCNQY